jgi:hypothetical protein
MSHIDTYRLLVDMSTTLKTIDTISTNKVDTIRQLAKKIDTTITNVLSDNSTVSEQDINNFQISVNNILSDTDISLEQNVVTESTIEMFQIGASPDDVNLPFNNNSTIPFEHGSILQKLIKIGFVNNDGTGHMIVSDVSDPDLATVLNAQISTALGTAPEGAVENLNITVSLNELKNMIGSRDIVTLFNTFEKPGLVARQLRDININSDPALSGLSNDVKINLQNAATILNLSTTPGEFATAQTNLKTLATYAGLYSTALGPTPNFNYSDLKRFMLQKDDDTIVSVTASMPVVSWGPDIPGIPLRDQMGPVDRTNRKDDGMSYIVDLGGINPVARQGKPNPLPATRYFNNGPNGATVTEGAFERYGGGKTVGINTTSEPVTIRTLHREIDGVIDVTIPPMSALWKLDRSTFDGGNKHAYYTVFSSSRPPPAGFMGVVFAPKQNRLGRGRGEIASGTTLANGVSSTGKQFMKQNEDGAILENNAEISAELKGLTSAFDGHAMHPIDLFKFMKDNSFVKGTQYLTIPANATLETVEDVLIPAGQFVPQTSQAIGTLMQFGNGKYIQDGGPNRFQSGLVPFLPGTLAYTPEWHINFIYYNVGNIECDGNTYPITDVATDTTNESWSKPKHNASFGPPGPNLNNTQESGFNPAFPDTFDPVQLRCGIKGAENIDYINKIKGTTYDEITLSMLQELENDNKIFVTEAPGGAMRGWVKFLVVNCPLPIILTVNIVSAENVTVPVVTPPVFNESKCETCSCSRGETNVSINGDLSPIWLDEDIDGQDTVIGDRILKFKVGDNIVIRSTTGTVHGVSLRIDNMVSGTVFDNTKTLETIQHEVLVELEEKILVNNKQDLENNFIALSDDIINFQGGIPITFIQKATINPINFPDGVPIADFTIKEGAQNASGTVACTVHSISMSFKFTICP